MYKLFWTALLAVVTTLTILFLASAVSKVEAQPRWSRTIEAEVYEGPVFAEPPDYDMVMFDCFPNPTKGTGFWSIRNTSSSLGSENLNQKLFATGASCAFALSYLYIERFELISSNPYVLRRRLTDEDKQEF